MSPFRLSFLAAAAAVAPLSAEPVITEFMASNSGAHPDGDGNFPDWIELHNPTSAVVDLSGWGLRDDSETWSFAPGTTLSPGGYLVVFASGQATGDYTDAAGNLHTTFKLDAGGEALALLRPDGSVAFEYASVPRQREDIAYGVASTRETLVLPTDPARHLVPDGAVPSTWRQPGFDDGSWQAGVAAVGFKTTPGPVLGGTSGSHTAYLIEAGTPGNQSYGGSLGMDFEVLEEIRVTDLGVFDAGSDGLSNTITAQLWSRSGNSGGAVLAALAFTPGNPGALEGGSRFKPLADPLVLAPGSYTMVAYGYGAAEPNGNQGVGALDGLDIDPAGGLLQFTGVGRYGNAGSFPANNDGGPANRYAAGTFKFGANSANDIGTDVEASMFGSNASVLVRVPFDAPGPATIDSLQFEIGYDDGFVAWLNGVEIARRNAPASPASDASATSDGNALETFTAALPPGTLTAAGNVLAIHGLNIAEDDGDFLVSPTLLGVSNDVLSARYFTNPTPGAANDPGGILGFVADTQFSIDRGYYESPISVAITSATPGATIRYTTDGSEPTETHGAVYSEPLAISSTTTLRAAAFRDGFEPTNVDTQSYLFLDDVAVQGASQPGYPTSWSGVAADYAMDENPADYARAAGDAAFTPAAARAAIVESLKAIPTISIVTDRDNLFDPATGIYLNPSGRGVLWERPVSVEVIGTDGAGRYQTDAGLRVMGFTSRNLNTTPKLNLRLLFKREYGDAKMGYPLLGDEGPDEFNTVALRGNIRDAWVTEWAGFGTATYIGDEWAKRTQFEMGQPAVRGTFAHVYINGIYWGVYNPTERPDDDFAETYLGGDKSEYDVVKFCCPDRHIAGSIAAWDELLSASRAGLASTAAYQRVQGRDPDGSLNPAFPVLIDVDNFIDYAIHGQYFAQADWPGNYYVIRDRVPGRTEGFKFFTWDNDLPFGGGTPTSGNKVQPDPGHNWWTESPGEMDIALRANPDYRMRFADRVYRHYFHGGALTQASNVARYQALADTVRPALFAESARWGDARGSALRTVQEHWDARIAHMLNNYFPFRQATVFSQMRQHGLYPDLDAPEFNQRGGHVPPGFGVNFDADATVYYTTDGSDPRLPGGAINPGAATASSGIVTTKLVDTGDAVRVLVPSDGTSDATWRNLGFDDGAWTAGTTGVGYDSNSDYDNEISLDLTAMRGTNTTAYLRVPFGGANAADFQSLTLRMKFDDGFVAYLNGTHIAARNAPPSPDWQSGATAFPSDAEAQNFVDFDVTAHKDLLLPGGNLLAIHGLNFGANSSDFLIVPELVGESLSGGDTVSLDETTQIRARAFDGAEWSAINSATFIVGDAPAVSNIAVSEIMYHPAAGDPAGEFLELTNISASTVDLTASRLVDGVTFEFPFGATLAPGARAIVAADPAAFAAVHPGATVYGPYTGALDNGGERIALADSAGTEFLAFEYDDDTPWPESPDGAGPSLVLIHPESAPDHSLATNWRPSSADGGNPGSTDTVPFAGGDLLSYALAGAPRFDFTNATLSVPLRATADDAEVIPQWSSDLIDWNSGGFDDLARGSWRLATPPAGDGRLFLRLEVRER